MNSTGTKHSNSIERRHLRRFGLTVGIAFLVFAALLFWRHKPAWPYFGGAGTLLGLAGLLVPTLLRPIERVWMSVARAMGWVMTRVILGIVFVVIFVPAGLILRLLRKDPLSMRFDPRAETYWHDRSKDKPAPEQMERMF